MNKTIYLILIDDEFAVFAVEDKGNSRALHAHLSPEHDMGIPEIKLLAAAHGWKVVSRKIKDHERYRYEWE